LSTTPTQSDLEKPQRHPLAVAWDEWSAAEEGFGALHGINIGVSEKYNVYLVNRLRLAFDAGAAAERKILYGSKK